MSRLLLLFILFIVRISFSADLLVTIGSAAPLTGPVAQLGLDCDRGVRLAVEELNAHPLHTVSGRRIRFRLISMDDQNDPRAATIVAQRMVDAHVSAVMGHLTSGCTIPASVIYFKNHILEFSPSSNPLYTSRGMDVTFRIMGTDQRQGEGLAYYATHHLHAHRIAVLDDATTYGQGLADQFVRHLGLDQARTHIVDREYIASDMIDFIAVLLRMSRQHPDLIFFGGTAAQSAPMLKQMKRLSFLPSFLSGDMSCTYEFVALAGSLPNPVYCSTSSLALSVMPGGAVFSSEYEKRFSAKVLLYSPYYYDAVFFLAKAIAQSDSNDPRRILPFLHKISYQGVTGLFSFKKNGDLSNVPVTVYAYADHRLSVVSVIR